MCIRMPAYKPHNLALHSPSHIAALRSGAVRSFRVPSLERIG